MIGWWHNSWSVWFAPVFGLVLVVGIGSDGSGEGYPLAIAVATSQAMVIVAPLTSLAAAREGARLRSGRILQFPVVRRRAAIFGFPLILIVSIPVLMVTVILLRRAGLAGLLVLAVSVMMVIAWALFGMLAGLVAPSVVALPLSLLIPAGVLILPPALEPVWLRHLTGAWEGCCLSNQVLAPAAISAGLVSNTTLALVAITALASVGRFGRAGIAAASMTVGVAGVVLASSLASGLGVFPVAPRQDPTTCFEAGAEICVWGEHVALRERLLVVAPPLFAGWRKAGVELPARFDEATYVWGEASSAPMFVSMRSDDLSLSVSLAAGMIGPTVCSRGTGTAAEATDPTQALAMLLLAGGVDESSVVKRIGEHHALRAAELLAEGNVDLNDVVQRVRACR